MWSKNYDVWTVLQQRHLVFFFLVYDNKTALTIMHVDVNNILFPIWAHVFLMLVMENVFSTLWPSYGERVSIHNVDCDTLI
jgi:hypothetical protein